MFSRVQLRATIGGLRLVLISDLHELPVLDLKAKEFTANAKDWSADVSVLVCCPSVPNQNQHGAG